MQLRPLSISLRVELPLAHLQGLNVTRCVVCATKMTDFLGEGVRRLLEKERGIEVVLLSGQQLDTERQLADIKPEVIILQKSSRGYQGISLDRALELSPNALVVVFNLAEDFVRLCYGAQAPVDNSIVLAEAIRFRQSCWPERVFEWAQQG